MARPTLITHPKFAKLAHRLKSRALARGSLELIWESCYASGNPFLGDAEALEAAADWQGERGELAKALVDCRFVDIYQHSSGEQMDTNGGRLYVVHDLEDHAPDYVLKRWEREAKRRANGETIRSIRQNAIAKRWEKNRNVSHLNTNVATPTPITDPDLKKVGGQKLPARARSRSTAPDTDPPAAADAEDWEPDEQQSTPVWDEEPGEPQERTEAPETTETTAAPAIAPPARAAAARPVLQAVPATADPPTSATPPPTNPVKATPTPPYDPKRPALGSDLIQTFGARWERRHAKRFIPATFDARDAEDLVTAINAATEPGPPRAAVLEEITTCIDRFMVDERPFYNGHSFRKFREVLPELRAALNARPPPQAPPNPYCSAHTRYPDRPGPYFVPSCPRCRHYEAAATNRESEPTSLAEVANIGGAERFSERLKREQAEAQVRNGQSSAEVQTGVEAK